MATYCGIGPIPKGRKRAPPEYCIANKQVRYYGMVPIDQLLLQNKVQKYDLTKERLKLRKLFDKGKILVKQINLANLIIDDDRSRPVAVRNARKRKKTLLKKRDTLVKQIKAQQNHLKNLEKEDKKQKRRIRNEIKRIRIDPRYYAYI